MNEKRMTGMAWLLALWLILAMIFLAMCSCGSKKVITETIYEHDTVTVHKSDTVKEVVYKSRVDTVTNTEVHTYTLNNVGDTVKEIHHYHNTQKVIVVDSTYRYRAERDSLQKALVAEKSKNEKVVKQRPTMVDKVFFVAIILVFVVWIIRSKRF